MKKVRNVIGRWPSRETLADDCGVTEYALDQWEKRGKLPYRQWNNLIRSAKKHKIDGITLDFLFLFNKKNGVPNASSV